MSQEVNPQPEQAASRGSVSHTEPRFLVIGEVTKPHGLRGEMRVKIHTDLPERFTWLEKVYLGPPNQDPDPEPVLVEAVRFNKGMALLKLRGFDDRLAVERLRSCWLQVPLSDAIPLEEGGFFLFQTVGLSVVTVDGESLGVVVEVIETKANNVYVVDGPRGEILLPDIAEVITSVDLDARLMTVDPLPGLL